jgi:hypothetical protein
VAPNITKSVALATEIVAVAPRARPRPTRRHTVHRKSSQSDKGPFKPISPVGFYLPSTGDGGNAHSLKPERIERVDLAAIYEDAR